MLRLFRQYYPMRNILFALGEGIFIFLAVVLTSVILGSDELTVVDEYLLLKTMLIAFICQTCLYYNDLYDLTVVNTYGELFVRLLQSLGVASFILAGIYFVFPGAIIGRGIFLFSVFFIIFFIICWRILYRVILNKGFFNQNVVILGSSELAGKIIQEIHSRQDCGYNLILTVPDCNADSDNDASECKLILDENYKGLCQNVVVNKIKKIVVALRDRRGAFPLKELLNCRMVGVDVIDGNSFYELLTGKLMVNNINPSWLIFSDGFRKSKSRRILKRAADIAISLIMLILLSPLILLTAVLIKIDSRGPVFFSQDRVGYRRKTYKVHKFRSMIADAEKKSGPVWAQSGDDRITRIGRFIRKWRVDEIPQLWNVFKGEMSFVGPRPEREYFIKQLEEIIPYYGERFHVKPGLTGWAQVSYGYGASIEDAVEKLNYELFYIKNMSMLFDFLIIVKTVKTVIFGKGQ